ncbi:hypothetical protein QYE76_058333 [Lolium multiflorum]|uniref:Retrotransposon gag domain-containing protein n=1 Tax=Lolium multiflorum TaxID=4521 RepID=A0AAD8T626_LOLMU|nr:hypothetical protein QYE76_058333 [Lolium multiflorum]
MEPANVKFYQLGNGGDLIFERDIDFLSDSLGRPHPEFHGVQVNDQHGGELQWIITADLRGKVEPPTSERILFSFRESTGWTDSLVPFWRDLRVYGSSASQREPGCNDATAADPDDRQGDRRAERQATIAALQQLANNQHGHGNHDHPGSKLKNFQNTNPPVFSKTEEPLDADDWLQTMENNLEVAGVEENEKVLFATHYLAGPARAWWTSTRAMNAGQMMTWADFKLKFSKYHVPPGLIKKMRDEFRELKQGRMSVVEYRDRFLTLSRYAPDETDTNEKRKERFLNGLHDEMRRLSQHPLCRPRSPSGFFHPDGRQTTSSK